ncbi:MAG: hypothetical protein QCH99_09740 [Candidatus Bathyarchaeota archaeon]|nr:hypothetical protein [Candidatus Bathyarchaeum tardum]
MWIKDFLLRGSRKLGLVFDAGAGVLFFALTSEQWYIISGAAIGLIIGSALTIMASKLKMS